MTGLVKFMSVPRMAGVVVSCALIAAVGIADIAAPRNVNPAILYPVAIVASGWARDRRLTWTLVLVTLALIFLAMAVKPEALGIPLVWVLYFNRFSAALAVLLIALAMHFVIGAYNHTLRLQRDLEANNERLRAANSEVAAREEEIAQQNEELQSQTEELERQAEELRVTNEEMVMRERMLEHLLSLSRSLTGSLSRTQAMSVVCEAVPLLLSGKAVAATVLIREGEDRLVVDCHHGFGTAGPDVRELPLASSFAHLVITRGQTGYLQDIDLRPDLKILQPQSGERFHSVISTPLRIAGEWVGALEAYSTETRAWSGDEIALLESLAAQTSISLGSAQLFDEIEQERSRFAAVVNSLPVGVVMADADLKHIRLNPAGAVMLNLPRDVDMSDGELRKALTVMRHGKVVPFEENVLYRAIRENREVIGEEMEIVFPDGRRTTLLASGAPITNRDGQVLGGVSSFADITRNKRLEQELDRQRREAEEAGVRKTRFLAAVSHDIRTPANAINLLAELIRRSASNPAMADEVAELAGELQQSSAALVNLVTDVLDLARYDTGKIELHESEFWLTDAVAEEIQQISPVARSKSLYLKFEPPAQNIRIRTDRIKLSRVLGNLLNNAIKFTNEGGVTVTILPKDDASVELRVSDTGVGIEADYIPRIFDEFFQLRNPERDAAKGTGLGLTICKRLLDAMGAQMEVQSQVGRGTTFAMTLPAAIVVEVVPGTGRQVLPKTEPLRPDSRPLAGLKVLLVEDHGSSRAATAQILKQEGAELAEAPNGGAAIRLLHEFQPDVLLLDMMLPDMSGADVLSAACSDGHRPPRSVVVLTGDMTNPRLDDLRSRGNCVVLHKPVVLDDLVNLLRERAQRDPA